MRRVRISRRPKPVHAACVDDVCFIRGPEHWQDGACSEVNAAPADVKGAFPLRAIIDDHAAAAADAGIVEQQVNAIGGMLCLSLDSVYRSAICGLISNLEVTANSRS
jgi:hypothetical protein